LGQIQFQTARLQPPHHVAAVPMIKDYKTKYSDFYYGGVFRREHTEAMEQLGFITVESVLNHPTKDIFWVGAEIINDYPESFKVPMLLISGWFDHYPSDVIRAFKDIRARSDISVRNQHKLIMGPWTHEKVGELEQGELQYPVAEGIPIEAIRQFFDYHILGAKNGWSLLPAIRYYQLGDEEWRQTSDWNTISTKFDTLYFHEQRALKFEPPPPVMSPLATTPDTIIYNPRDPSPTIGGCRFNPFDKKTPIGPYDISKNVESRNDIIVYSTEVLTDDITITINGQIKIELFVSSDKKDTDFSGRLCDVFPDGRSMIMTQGIRRMRFRNNYAPEELMTPGTIYPVTIELDEIGITFRKGHRLRIDITSSNYPMFDININDADSMYVAGGDTLIATNLVYCSAENSSKIILPVSEPSDVTDTQFNSRESIRIYPNPASSYLNIKFDYDNNYKYDIDLVDLFDRKILKLADGEVIQGNSDLYFDISGLNDGMYFIKIKRKAEIITIPLVILK
jgi:putative CocE/NonD family hydrolase